MHNWRTGTQRSKSTTGVSLQHENMRLSTDVRNCDEQISTSPGSRTNERIRGFARVDHHGLHSWSIATITITSALPANHHSRMSRPLDISTLSIGNCLLESANAALCYRLLALGRALLPSIISCLVQGVQPSIGPPTGEHCDECMIANLGNFRSALTLMYM